MTPEYFENIKHNHFYEFLKQNGIHWNQMAQTNMATLIMPENVARISENSNNYELYLCYEGLADFFRYEISENHFILINERNDIIINLSKKWQTFLKEFKKQNNVDDTLNI